jgi:hypothetical protein
MMSWAQPRLVMTPCTNLLEILVPCDTAYSGILEEETYEDRNEGVIWNAAMHDTSSFGC